MSRWVFLRHGESTANADRLLSGWNDVPLTALGRAQAEAAGWALAGRAFGRVVSSDLSRARDTATLVLAAARAAGGPAAPPIELDGRLRERNLGAWQGLGYDLLRERGFMARLLTWEGRPPGGESHADLAWRTVSALSAISDDGHQDVLLVGHGGVIRTLLGLLDGLPGEAIGRNQIPNAEPLVRDLSPGAWGRIFSALEAGALPGCHPADPPPGPGLVLASGSPRRRSLLAAVGVPIAAIRPPCIPEAPEAGEDATAYVRRLAQDKAAAVSAPGRWVLAADTTVHRDGRLFEKPADAAEARSMLLALAGGWHTVSTGWCLRWSGPDAPANGVLAVEHSQVRFRDFGPAEAAAYVARGESLDKAGAYGIQGQGAALVAEVRGSHSNVVGLPMDAVVPALHRVGLLPAPA